MLAAFSGLAWEGMWGWHVLYITHPVEVFNAVFGFFTRTPLNLLFPLSFFLLPPVAGAVWRFGRGLGWGRWARMVAAVGVCGALISLIGMDTPVDCAVGCAGCGTVLSMARVLRGERGGWGALLVFSLWMMVAKQSALLTCFVFWACFSVALLWRVRAHWRGAVVRLALCGGLLVGGLCWVCAAPYLTSWVRVGHPLYPACTVDAERFPTHDITFDFHIRNADAQAMGHVGHFLNAFLSPRLCRAYYAWATGRADFMPYCEPWKQAGPGMTGHGAPTLAGWRWALLLSVGVLLAFGGRGCRFPVLACALGAFCFPTHYLGYLRYLPWVMLLPGLAAGALVRTVGQRWRRVAWGLGVVLMAGCVARATLFVAITLDQAFEVDEASRDPGIRAFVVEREALRNHFLLLTRAVPAWHTVQVLRAEEAPADEEVRVLAVPHFHVLLGEGREPPTSRYRTIRACPSRLGRYLRYGTFVPWTLARTFPLLAWRRVQTLWVADGR